MGAAETDQLEKYRRYIQKRRVSPAGESGELDAKREEDSVTVQPEYNSSIPDPNSIWNDRETEPVRRDKEENERVSNSRFNPGYQPGNRYPPGTPYAPRRSDTGLYKKLYARSGHKAPAYATPYRSNAGGHAEIEDNRVTTLAVKLIKQALACFAILGILILMQSRPEMKDALAVVKKQVVETNYEPQIIIDGIKDLFNQITTALGGNSAKE